MIPGRIVNTSSGQIELPENAGMSFENIDTKIENVNDEQPCYPCWLGQWKECDCL